MNTNRANIKKSSNKHDVIIIFANALFFQVMGWLALVNSYHLPNGKGAEAVFGRSRVSLIDVVYYFQLFLQV